MEAPISLCPCDCEHNFARIWARLHQNIPCEIHRTSGSDLEIQPRSMVREPVPWCQGVDHDVGVGDRQNSGFTRDDVNWGMRSRADPRQIFFRHDSQVYQVTIVPLLGRPWKRASHPRRLQFSRSGTKNGRSPLRPW